jgi:hypothetical protein
MVGPLLDLWNFVQPPLPQVTMTVCKPAPGRLESGVRTLTLARGESTTFELKAQQLASNTEVRLVDLPDGVSYQLLGREADQLTLKLEASHEAALGSFDISAEAEVNRRRISRRPITVSIQPAPRSLAQGTR